MRHRQVEMIILMGVKHAHWKIPHTTKAWFYLTILFMLTVLVACQPTASILETPIRGIIGETETISTYSATNSQLISHGLASNPASTLINTSSTTVSTSTEIYLPLVANRSSQSVVFGVIGDYGTGGLAEADVANLMLGWQPDFIITLGDNNYPDGSAGHIDQAIGQFFHSYIYPYTGGYGGGSDVNRFFPCLGNHDLRTNNGQPYYDYFTLPGNERYYDFSWGPVHLFALNDTSSEPDGVTAGSVQGAWLQAGLAASTSPWNLVYMHLAPYSSGLHGSTTIAQWPYQAWGADAVLAAHDHTYERLLENGLTYFVSGLGGATIYDFVNIVDGSLVRYNADYGAMRVVATDASILFEFINRSGEVVDSYEMMK